MGGPSGTSRNVCDSAGAGCTSRTNKSIIGAGPHTVKENYLQGVYIENLKEHVVSSVQ